MIKNDSNMTEQILESDEQGITAKSDGVKLIRRKFYAADLVNNVGKFEQKIVIQSHKLPGEMKTLASNGWDLAKHPRRLSDNKILERLSPDGLQKKFKLS